MLELLFVLHNLLCELRVADRLSSPVSLERRQASQCTFAFLPALLYF